MTYIDETLCLANSFILSLCYNSWTLPWHLVVTKLWCPSFLTITRCVALMLQLQETYIQLENTDGPLKHTFTENHIISRFIKTHFWNIWYRQHKNSWLYWFELLMAKLCLSVRKDRKWSPYLHYSSCAPQIPKWTIVCAFLGLTVSVFFICKNSKGKSD